MTPLDLVTPLLAQGLQFSVPAALMILFVIVSVLMILIVLIQRPQGGGLSGAFGAAADGAGQTAFGAKTGDALTLATVTTFVIFLLTAVGLNFALRPEIEQQAPPVAAPTQTEGGAQGEDPGLQVTGQDGSGVQAERMTQEQIDAMLQGLQNQGAAPVTDEPATNDEPDPAGG